MWGKIILFISGVWEKTVQQGYQNCFLRVQTINLGFPKFFQYCERNWQTSREKKNRVFELMICLLFSKSSRKSLIQDIAIVVGVFQKLRMCIGQKKFFVRFLVPKICTCILLYLRSLACQSPV